MKKFRTSMWLIAIGIIAWSIWVDVFTYNVYFQTDKPIVLYCLDGIIFNLPKIMMPIAIAMVSYVYDFFIAGIIAKHKLKNENRAN